MTLLSWLLHVYWIKYSILCKFHLFILLFFSTSKEQCSKSNLPIPLYFHQVKKQKSYQISLYYYQILLNYHIFLNNDIFLMLSDECRCGIFHT